MDTIRRISFSKCEVVAQLAKMGAVLLRTNTDFPFHGVIIKRGSFVPPVIVQEMKDDVVAAAIDMEQWEVCPLD